MMEYKLRHVGCTDTERLLCASYIILGHIPAHNSIPVFLTLNYTPGNFPATTLTLAISCSLYSFTFILTWFTCKTIWWLYFELLQLTHGKNRHTNKCKSSVKHPNEMLSDNLRFSTLTPCVCCLHQPKDHCTVKKKLSHHAGPKRQCFWDPAGGWRCSEVGNLTWLRGPNIHSALRRPSSHQLCLWWTLPHLLADAPEVCTH